MSGRQSPGNHGSGKASGSHGNEREGVFVLKGRFGFVLSEKEDVPDVFVQGPSLRLAFDGDRVRVRVRAGGGSGGRRGPGGRGDRLEGEIVRVLQRARTTLVGVYRARPGGPVLEAEDGGVEVALRVPAGLHPREGDLAVARITAWPEGRNPARGELAEVLGRRGRPEVDIRAVVRHYEWPDAFTPGAEREAAAFGREVPESAWRGRKTYFHLPVFTIDGADAKDFDDAVSLEPLPGGRWRLGVHIADVSHYVRPGTELDREARKRATSVYLVGKVLPMLPHALSDQLCSLRPGEPRLTLTCSMDLDGEGRLVGRRLEESVIRSARRFTYEEVDAVLRGGSVPNLPGPVRESVLSMGRLARRVRARRFARGSLDFDFPEPLVVADAEGRPVDVKRRERLESHRLIEDFMILANESVAEEMSRGPFLYRIHPPPDARQRTRLEEFLRALGLPVPPDLRQGRPSAVQKVLLGARGTTVESVVNMVALRSLSQAVYSPRNAGHFGLASACYTHFTSPIRRYPDLLVHRLVRERLRGGGGRDAEHRWRPLLQDASAHCSRRERVAVDAERELLDLRRVQVMERRVGQSFDGIVTGTARFGFFVQLKEVFVEGLVHVSSLSGDDYQFDELRHTLRGRRTGRLFHVGQPVRVRLKAADVFKKQLDFVLADDRPHRGGASPPIRA